MSAVAVGLTGAIRSMFITSKLVIPDVLPASSLARKNTVPFSVNGTAPV